MCSERTSRARFAATPATPTNSCGSRTGSTTSTPPASCCTRRPTRSCTARTVLHGPDSGFITTEQYAASRAHRGTAEVQADGAAYVLADLLGLDTRHASVGYVAGWATAAAGSTTDTEAITAAVRGTAAAILHAVNTIAAAIGLDD